MAKKVKNSELDILLKGSGIGHLADQPEVMIVPTRFVGFNRATRIGGVPASSILLVYGPSGQGKTAFALGLVNSFQTHGHLATFVDAEHTLDRTWAGNCDVDPDRLGYERPDTYEETTKKVQKVLKNYQAARDKGQIHPGKALLVVVDSINKLVPKTELENPANVGRGFPLRALFNTDWLDRLTPIIHRLPILFVILAHEKKKMDAKPFEREEKIKGGSALYYDSTLVVHIKTRSTERMVIKGGDGKEKKIEVAHLHEGWVEKNKVGVCHEYFKFFMSTGREVPVGFDLAREVMEEARLRGGGSPLVRKRGAIWEYSEIPGGKIKGDAVLRKALREDPKLLQAVVDDLNETALGLWDVVEEDPDEQ